MTYCYDPLQQQYQIGRVREILQGQIDDAEDGKLFRGGVYSESPMLRHEQSISMEKYWDEVKRGMRKRPRRYKQGGARKKNKWIQFIEKHKGQGYSLKELSCKYDKQKKGSGVVIGGRRRKYRQTKADRMRESRAMKKYYSQRMGGRKKYSQSAMDKLHEKLGMDAYWEGYHAAKGGSGKYYKESPALRKKQSMAMKKYYAKRKRGRGIVVSRPYRKKYYQTAKDRADERRAMEEHWMLKKGTHPKYQQEYRNRLEAQLKRDPSMNYNRPYYMEGPQQVKRMMGGSRNAWTRFLHDNRGEGYSMKEMARMYKAEKKR